MDSDALISEVLFKAIRSSGSGGQHVNKVATKIELQFDIEKSQILSEEEKQKIKEGLASRLTKENVLILHCSETRSQYKNKQLVIKKFLSLIEDSLVEQKERIATKIPKAVIKKRLENKRRQSDKKANRKKPDLE